MIIIIIVAVVVNDNVLVNIGAMPTELLCSLVYTTSRIVFLR